MDDQEGDGACDGEGVCSLGNSVFADLVEKMGRVRLMVGRASRCPI